MNTYVLTRKRFWVLVALHAGETVGFWGGMFILALVDWRIVLGLFCLAVAKASYKIKKDLKA